MKRKFVLLLWIMACNAWAASFDCAKARSMVEKAICNDPELSKLDEELAGAYKSALATHPLPSYVRARQVDWLRRLQNLDGPSVLPGLRTKYRSRVSHLKTASQVVVYSDAEEKFSYGGGDTTVELWPSPDAKWLISIWGGFHHDPVNSEPNREVWVGCEFEGTINEPFKQTGKNSASSKEGESVSFVLNQKALGFGDDPAGCVGRGRIRSDELKRVLKK
ncbi:MAG: lysozyme inhibitor LprI family protein [Acidobacteriota bacterium]|jgi:uncharacterized protein